MLSDRFEFEMFPSVSLFGKIVPMYGLCMVLGVILSCSAAFARAKKFKLDINNLIVIAAAAVGGGLICAKILYIAVTFRLSDILSMIANGSFDFILQSGLVYYGGLIGGILTAFLTVKLLKEDVDKVVLSIVPCIPLGHSFGRLGCLFAGCCYGSEYNGFLAVLLNINGTVVSTFPIQAVEAALNLFLFFGLVCIASRIKKGVLLLPIYLYAYSAIRFCLEFFRGDSVRGMLCGLSTSQWICIVIALVCTIYLITQKTIKRKRIQHI